MTMIVRFIELLLFDAWTSQSGHGKKKLHALEPSVHHEQDTRTKREIAANAEIQHRRSVDSSAPAGVGGGKRRAHRVSSNS